MNINKHLKYPSMFWLNQQTVDSYGLFITVEMT